MDYTTDYHSHSYSADMDMHLVSPETMTTTGVPAHQLLPIEHCVLTPGDPSPLGRTEDGELAYPEYPDEAALSIARIDAARLAHMVATLHGFTEEPTPPYATDTPQALFIDLLNAALPSVFYQESAHGTIARKSDIQTLIKGDFEALKHRWGQTQS